MLPFLSIALLIWFDSCLNKAASTEPEAASMTQSHRITLFLYWTSVLKLRRHLNSEFQNGDKAKWPIPPKVHSLSVCYHHCSTLIVLHGVDYSHQTWCSKRHRYLSAATYGLVGCSLVMNFLSLKQVYPTLYTPLPIARGRRRRRYR